MFQQQVSSKKERNKLPKFSAPANMVSLRTPSSSNGNSSNAMAGSSSTRTASNNGPSQATSPSSHQQPPQGASSGLSTDAYTHPSKSTSSDLGLPSRQYASLTSSKSSTNPSHTHPHPAYTATKDAIPGPLPGPSQQMADIPHASFTSQHQHKLPNGSTAAAPSSVSGSQDGSRSGKVPQSKRAPVDPFDAPAVTFRSSLSPPSGLAIPDIPYGQGRGPLPRKSSGSIASVTGSRAASTKSGRAKVFTPSDAHTGIRKIPGQEGVMENKRALQENTSRNAAVSNDYNLVTVASSGSAGQAHPAPPPSTTLFTPSAPLTVTAPVVTGQARKATQIDQEHLAEWRQEHEPSGVLTAGNTIVVTSPSAASKQPTKSAMKGGNSQAQARSWADLVRPMSHVQLAEQAVKNIGLTDAEISARDKEQTEASERERMQQEAKAANEAAKKKRVSIALPGSTAPTAAAAPASTTAAGDKAPRHSSPPPAGPSGTGTGDAAVPVSGDAAAQPAAKDTTDTRSLASNATGGSALFSNVMSRKKNLEEILAGVENSRSTVLLYPRGLVNTGNACFMNSILQTLLFTAPFYNLINLIGSNTAEDLSGKTPLLDAMVSYLAEFRTHDATHETQLRSGESYEQELNRNDAFIPSIIYHALNKNARFAQMGFANPSSASSRGTSLSNGAYGSGSALGSGSHVYRPPSAKHQHGAGGYLSQEDAQEFLGFFLDTIHEELLVKIDQFDKQNWERASKGYRAGMDSLTRQSVNSAAAYDAITAPAGAGQQPAVGASSASVRSASHATNGGAEDEEWLEVGQKGRTANTRTTEHQESAITKIFGGQLRSVLRCPGQKDSVTLEPFMSLQLEIEQPNVYTIEDALSFISKPETLSDVANRNNLKGDATKQLFIDTLPPVLILHLKRFVYDSRAGGVLKSHKVVSYGTELEVPKDCLAPAKRTSAQMARNNHYRLNGVVFHHGKSAAGGHYTVLQRQNNGRWLNIDDTTITPVPVEEVVVDRDRENMRLSLPSASSLRGVPEKSAYLLFYQRV